MNRSATTSVLSVLLFLNVVIHSANCAAQSVRLPAGLNPVDEYRLAFVTFGTRDATSSDIADYNTFVTDEANAPRSIVYGLQTDWFAIASTNDVDAIQNTGTDPTPNGDPGVPIYLVDGLTRVANHYDNMWDGDSAGFGFLLAPLHLTQYGIAPRSTINNVWTGSDNYGVAGGGGGPLGTLTPSLGVTLSPNGRWINNRYTSSASQEKALYGISSVLIAVPEPSTASLLSIVVFAFLQQRMRRSHRPM